MALGWIINVYLEPLAAGSFASSRDHASAAAMNDIGDQ
jgi:hypothetical protein